MNLEKLQSDLNINFIDINLLESALTHKSFYLNTKIEIQLILKNLIKLRN